MSEKGSTRLEKSTADGNDPEPGSLYKVHDVLNHDLALALSTGPQLKPLSSQAFRLYAVLLVAFMGSLSTGFDASVVSGVNGMTQFTDYFDIEGGATGGGQGIIAAMLLSIFSFGAISGSFVAGQLADRWGRRGGMFIASLFIFAGVSTVTAAQSRIYLFFGRFLLGFGAVLNGSAAIAYVVEMSPPQWRGRLAGLYTTFAFVGAVVCSALVIATGRINSSLAWRLPFAFQFIPTTILAVGLCFIPESPRWLISVGRKEEAHQILARYHANGDMDSALVVLEWQELETCIKQDGTNKRWWDYSELFNSRSARYRTFVICWLGLCSQWSGSGIFYYITVVFDLAGVKTQQGRLVFSFASVALAGLGSLVGSLVVDRIGRRTLWLWGSASTAAMIALAAGCTAKAQSDAAITFLRIYPSECLNFSNRAKGLAMFALIASLASLVNTFAGALVLKTIGWKYMLVPAAWSAVQTVVVWLCAPETKGRTLEELDEIFENPHPVNASLNKHRGSATSES